MLQEIITYIIVTIAFSYFLYGVFRFFVPKANASACGGCASCAFKSELKKVNYQLPKGLPITDKR